MIFHLVIKVHFFFCVLKSVYLKFKFHTSVPPKTNHGGGDLSYYSAVCSKIYISLQQCSPLEAVVGDYDHDYNHFLWKW